MGWSHLTVCTSGCCSPFGPSLFSVWPLQATVASGNSPRDENTARANHVVSTPLGLLMLAHRASHVPEEVVKFSRFSPRTGRARHTLARPKDTAIREPSDARRLASVVFAGRQVTARTFELALR